jgi:hypothetical protein
VIIPNGFGQAAIRYNLSGDTDPMYVVFGFDNNAGLSDPVTAANSIQGAWVATGNLGDPAIRYTAWTISLSVVTLMTATGPVTGTATTTSAGTAGTGATLPANCATLVRKTTTRGGREGRGRMYLPCATFQEGDVDLNGFILASVVTNLNTRASATSAALLALSLPMQLLHSDVALAPDTVVGLSVQQLIATQRRRLRK